MAFDIEAHRGGRALRPENTLAVVRQRVVDGRRYAGAGYRRDRGPRDRRVARARAQSGSRAQRRGRLRRAARHSVRPAAPRRGQEIRRRANPPRQRLRRAIPGPALDPEHADPDIAPRCSRWCANPATPACASTSRPRSIRTIRISRPIPNSSSRCCSSSSDARNSATAIMVQSFDWRTLQLVQQRAPEIPTVYLTLQSRPSRRRSLWTRPPMDRRLRPGQARTLGPAQRSRPQAARSGRRYFATSTPPLVAEAHGLGLKVVVWTVNKPDEMTALIDIGVDGIISDRPDLLRQVAGEEGRSFAARISRDAVACGIDSLDVVAAKERRERTLSQRRPGESRDPYVDGPRAARVFRWSDRIACIHMSGLLVRLVDRWPRWFSATRVPNTPATLTGQWVPRVVSHLGSIDPTICLLLQLRLNRLAN